MPEHYLLCQLPRQSAVCDGINHQRHWDRHGCTKYATNLPANACLDMNQFILLCDFQEKCEKIYSSASAEIVDR